ncbi:MAG TPA: exo-alpha-sialidase [Dermatophilaceae bacterium]|nr:exo-alpha-sialidase [Dermatophilaceae bacterium]
MHHLAYDATTLLLGTHVGLYAQSPARQPKRLGTSTFDVMGLAHDGTRWLASGHPGDGEDLPSDLGLRQSTDGRTWSTVSLLGKVDFHRLAASGRTVIGVSAHDGALMRSQDGGATWSTLTNPGVFDLAIDPSAPATVVATTETGPVRSTDAGSSWQRLAGAPLVARIAWTGRTLYAVAPDGQVHVTTNRGDTWTARGSVGGQPAALAAEGDTVAVLVADRVLESGDRGASFRPRLTGISS